MSYRQDLIGKTFGDFTVMDSAGTQGTHALWQCVCKKCGYSKVITASNLNFQKNICVICYNESRWTISKEDRLQLCSDYLSGMSGNDILEKYNMNDRTKIYRILDKYGVKPDRQNRSKE